MKVLIQFALHSLLPIVEEAIAKEGPVAVKWLEEQIAKIAAKYNVK